MNMHNFFYLLGMPSIRLESMHRQFFPNWICINTAPPALIQTIQSHCLKIFDRILGSVTYNNGYLLLCVAMTLGLAWYEMLRDGARWRAGQDAYIQQHKMADECQIAEFRANFCKTFQRGHALSFAHEVPPLTFRVPLQQSFNHPGAPGCVELHRLLW